jgi:PAS domain S-box-containing protein
MAYPLADGGLAIYVRDVSALVRSEVERRHAEEARREYEARFRSLFESMTEGVALHQLVYEAGAAVDYVVLDVNPAFELQTAMTAASVRGRPASKAYGTGQAPYLAEYTRVAESGEPFSFETYFEPLQRHFRITAVALEGARFATIFEDITERRAAEEALRRSEERFRLALSAAPVTVAAQDRDLRYVWAFNQRTAPPEGVIGKTDADIFTPEEADHLQEIKQRVLDEGVEFREQLWLDRPQGRMFLDTTNTPLCDEKGAVTGVGVTTVDLTPMKLAEEALRRHAEMLDLSHDAIIVWQPGGTIESWNRGAEEIYGFSQAEALGRVSHDLLSAIHQRPWRLIEATLREHGIWEGEVRHHARDGREIVVSTRLELIRGGDGVERVLETNRDISDQKRAEEALRLSERRLVEAQRIAHVGSWEWDIETGALSWSRELFEIYGVDPDTYTPTMEAFSGFIHPDDRGVVEGAVGQILGGGGRTDFEFRIIAADGSVHELHTVGEVTATNEDGGPRVMVGVNQDVTESRQAERALRESEARLRRFYEAGLVGVTYWNAEGEILDANDHFLDMVGYTREELEAGEIDWLEMTPAEFAHLDERSLAELQADGVNSTPFEKEYLRKDGTRVPVIVAGAMLDDERREGVAFVLDITDRKRVEEELRSAEAERIGEQERSRLARDLHDSVTQALFAATLKAEALTLADESLPRGASQVAEEVRRLNRGALAEMRTLLLELRGEPLEDVPIGQLLRHLVEAAEGRSSVNVRLAIHGDEVPPPALNASIYRITQEALNNVTRHARASTAWVDLEAETDSVVLVVRDNGCGFDPSVHDPTQMGLSSMRERAAEAGARFDLVTEPGGGTEITVSWPAA